MKIKRVTANHRKRAFEVETARGSYSFPFALLPLAPTAVNRVKEVHADQELDREGFTYVLEDGSENTVHLDAVLEYNVDPAHLNELLLYRLTVAARDAFEASGLGVRQVCRTLGTSPTQFYRLLDPTYYGKSAGQMLSLLHLLGVEVEVNFTRGLHPALRRAQVRSVGREAW